MGKNNNEIMVSVSCLVYNHEKYLRRCLDGFVNQKTNFKFEVLIHDDASTDGSADIIREYEIKYPDIIKPIYQKENQYSKHIGINKTYQYPRVKGKYIAFCEGDDFWTDENKLQKQYDALENHPQCGMCVHETTCVNEDGSPNDRVFPLVHFDSGVISGSKIIQNYPEWLFHLSSFFIRKDLLFKLYYDNTQLCKLCPVGDTLIQYFSAAFTDYYFIDSKMSTYRLFSNGSWTQRLRTENKITKTNERFIEFTKEFGRFLNDNCKGDYTDVIQEAIIRYKIQILLNKKEYKKIYQYRDSKYFSGFNKKLKLIVCLSKFIPGFERLYVKLK